MFICLHNQSIIIYKLYYVFIEEKRWKKEKKWYNHNKKKRKIIARKEVMNKKLTKIEKNGWQIIDRKTNKQLKTMHKLKEKKLQNDKRVEKKRNMTRGGRFYAKRS